VNKSPDKIPNKIMWYLAFIKHHCGYFKQSQCTISSPQLFIAPSQICLHLTYVLRLKLTQAKPKTPQSRQSQSNVLVSC